MGSLGAWHSRGTVECWDSKAKRFKKPAHPTFGAFSCLFNFLNSGLLPGYLDQLPVLHEKTPGNTGSCRVLVCSDSCSNGAEVNVLPTFHMTSRLPQVRQNVQAFSSQNNETKEVDDLDGWSYKYFFVLACIVFRHRQYHQCCFFLEAEIDSGCQKRRSTNSSYSLW